MLLTEAAARWRKLLSQLRVEVALAQNAAEAAGAVPVAGVGASAGTGASAPWLSPSGHELGGADDGLETDSELIAAGPPLVQASPSHAQAAADKATGDGDAVVPRLATAAEVELSHIRAFSPVRSVAATQALQGQCVVRDPWAPLPGADRGPQGQRCEHPADPSAEPVVAIVVVGRVPTTTVEVCDEAARTAAPCVKSCCAWAHRGLRTMGHRAGAWGAAATMGPMGRGRPHGAKGWVLGSGTCGDARRDSLCTGT